MKRFSSKLRCEVENKAVDAFLFDILKVCEKHQMAIGHWLFEASDDTSGNVACKTIEPREGGQ